MSGRDFGPQDRRGAPPVAINNESFARRYFGAPNAVGRTFQMKAPEGQPRPLYEVIGCRGELSACTTLAARKPHGGPS